MSQIQTVSSSRSQTGREGRKAPESTRYWRQWLCCNKIGVKFWGAEKMRLLIPTGKENKKHFRDLVAREQGLEGQGACPQQRQEREFQVEKDTKHRPAHTQHTQKFNELQIAQHLHHLTITHLQPSGTCFRSNSAPEGSSPLATFLSHVLLWMWGFIKTQWRSTWPLGCL